MPGFPRTVRVGGNRLRESDTGNPGVEQSDPAQMALEVEGEGESDPGADVVGDQE